jgi:rieske iron-sulfur protein
MRSMSEGDDAPSCCTRRALLGGAAALGVLLPLRSLAQEPSDAAKLRPQPGDRLVFADGDRAGQTLAPADLAPGAAPISAWPKEPAAKLVRNGSRLNLVRVLRLEPGGLSAKAAESAADGIVAYAAMCSHAGCDVLGWSTESHHLVCPCHGSEFDALDAAAVAKGPATRPLAMLPLRVEGDQLVVARGFTRAVGFKPL